MTLQFINIVLHGDKRKAGTESDYAKPDVDYAYNGQQNHQKHIFQLEAGDKHRYVNAYRSAEQSRKYQLAVPGVQLAFVRHILVALRKQELTEYTFTAIIYAAKIIYRSIIYS